ncbi:MAG: hypothetical protein IJ736_00260, partial [Firmicutes bacterium]|nr:hypothetical protein [Bacillota bacterium]
NVIPSYDLEIGELYMAESIIPNSEIPVLFDVTNTGKMPVDKINVEIIDVDGTTNYSQDFDQPLQPGETAEISAIYKTVETIVSGKKSANISTTSGKEEDLNNNTATAEIGLAYIEIEDISIKKNGDKYNVAVTVINSGYKDVSNVDVAISTDTEGESIIATQSIEAISAQDKKILNFVVDPASINTEDDVIVLNTVLSTSTEEANKGNNYKGFILEETPDKASFVFGDADGDNAVTAGDAAFVLQKALISTFELPLQEKTDDWLKYADADADNKITASDSAFILQKALVSTFELPAETK